MFGYVKPFKPQMRVCEYETYKAVYCGLCKQLGRTYGPFSRLTLSYDFTFLALLQMSLQDKPQDFSLRRCMLNPLKKAPCCEESGALEFAGGAAMLTLYFKLLDNYNDGGFVQRLGSLACKPLVWFAYRKAADVYPETASILYETISRQSLIESER